jgi:MerR family transcriptional regulator, thiopeptide resistance regulator
MLEIDIVPREFGDMADSITIGRLAKASGLSRSTLLYYDRMGLLCPVNRSQGNYRLYSAGDVERLRWIRCYRDAGIPLRQIAQILGGGGRTGAPSAAVLKHHLRFLDEQINTLRNQQRQAILLLEQITSGSSARASGEVDVRPPRALSAGRKKHFVQKEIDMVNKKRWVEIMKAAGFKEDDMRNWHRQFERLEPQAHQEFLESLGIEAAEIRQIRQSSAS